MNRRRFLHAGATLGAVGLLSRCGPLRQLESRATIPVIGYLGVNFAADPGNAERVAYFRQGLREQDLVESQNVAVDFRWAAGGGHPWAKEQTAALIGSGVRVIVASGTLWRPVREITDTVPIVTLAADGEGLIELRWVASLARPGGNITGLSNAGRELSRKMVEVLLGSVPQMRRLVLMSNLASNPQVEASVRETADKFALELLVVDVRTVAEVEPAFERARAWGAHAVTVDGLVPVTLLAGPVTSLAARHRLPAIYSNKEYVDAGGLMQYGSGRREEYAQRRAAWYVARILDGVKPGELPIEQVTAFQFVVSRRALADLGLTLPPLVAGLVTEWRQ